MKTTKTLQDHTVNFNNIQLLIDTRTGEILISSGFTTNEQDDNEEFTGTYLTGPDVGITISAHKRKYFDRYYGTITLSN